MRFVKNALFLKVLIFSKIAVAYNSGQKVVSEAGDAKEGYEDVLWALINSKQFVYIH